MSRRSLVLALAAVAVTIAGTGLAESAMAATGHLSRFEDRFLPAFPHPRPSHMQAVKATETHELACRKFYTFEHCPAPANMNKSSS